METAPRLDEVSIQRILCAVDLQPASDRVLDWANNIAQAYQAELSLVHVLPGITPGYMTPAQETDLRAQIQKLIDELQRRVGTQAEVLIEGGDPAKMAGEVAARWEADLLVIGRAADPGVVGRLDPTAYSIIQQSPCPVVNV